MLCPEKAQLEGRFRGKGLDADIHIDSLSVPECCDYLAEPVRRPASPPSALAANSYRPAAN